MTHGQKGKHVMSGVQKESRANGRVTLCLFGDAAAISGYMGKGKSLGEANADFAVAYADQSERDHQALVAALGSGRVAAEIGI
jgi:hypothetical protein